MEIFSSGRGDFDFIDFADEMIDLSIRVILEILFWESSFSTLRLCLQKLSGDCKHWNSALKSSSLVGSNFIASGYGGLSRCFYISYTRLGVPFFFGVLINSFLGLLLWQGIYVFRRFNFCFCGKLSFNGSSEVSPLRLCTRLLISKELSKCEVELRFLFFLGVFFFSIW
jgi:hypothetical protein